MTFRLVLALTALTCTLWGIATVLALGQVAGWSMIAIGLGAGVISTEHKRRNYTAPAQSAPTSSAINNRQKYRFSGAKQPSPASTHASR